MTEKPSYYRVQSKRERRLQPDWLKKIALRAFTSDEIMDIVRNKLTPKEQIDFLRSWYPREIKTESSSTFTLQIEGLARQVIGPHTQKAITTTTTMDDDVDES